MQLPTHGHPLHTRSLTITVTQQPNGSWHARGDIIDLRKCSFVPMTYDIQPAGVVHQMSIDARVDPITRRLESIDVEQPTVAVEPSEVSRGECCRDPAPRLQEMVGETLGSGFPKRLSQVFGGARGCSHLLTLFQLMGSALPRVLELEADQVAELGAGPGSARQAGERIFRRAVFLDGFEIDDENVGVGIQLADFLTRPRVAVVHPLERLAFQHDARAYAVVKRESLAIAELRTATRYRTADTLGDARWETLDGETADIVGSAIMGGLAGKLLRLYGNTPKRSVMLDCLLQLAPGYIQVMAALMEKWFEPSSGSGLSVAGSDDEPSVATVGGTPDSCYIWRSGGPMAELRVAGFGEDGS